MTLLYLGFTAGLNLAGSAGKATDWINAQLGANMTGLGAFLVGLVIVIIIDAGLSGE